ncbi:hypothetical protein GOBAR_DD00662 [Gossypium barbadense]|nr:hypothetical protein GOBAR_DD00662 [Gossypium barbadense]
MVVSISATGFKSGLGTPFYGSWGSSSSSDSTRWLTQFRASRQIIGKKRFNQLRGKAIALHSQVITEFCKSIGADAKQRQGLIRLAKKNGERLGFLA